MIPSMSLVESCVPLNPALNDLAAIITSNAYAKANTYEI
jgi:hypothetical protein